MFILDVSTEAAFAVMVVFATEYPAAKPGEPPGILLLQPMFHFSAFSILSNSAR
jgi:hypothetical protein